MRSTTVLAAVFAALISTVTVAQDQGRPTSVSNTVPQAWRTAESQNRANEIVKAEWAWSRGWTGLGSGILIMDTGIDTAHRDFQGRIRSTLDLSARGITDRVGHGTHVAGVAAGARNAVGAHGVAFDSHLYIAKLSDNRAITAQRARQALVWAQQFPDIRVANFSANTQFNATYTRAMRNSGAGIYVSGDARYRGQAFYNFERAEDWANALSPGMVLTVSAGNQNLPYPQNPAAFAAATDARGQLILRGQMLIVGNWNDRAGRIESARAGHVCRDMQGTVCRDPYRTWQFYILAPGMAVNSTAPGGGARTMSGSSQAAPVVAGAVAIIGQMWPYMPADQVVQLLLRTARRDLPGYHETTHGQGLLDLDQATRPQGTLGLRTRGRTVGRQALTGAMGAAGVMMPSSIAVLDEYDRDFVMTLAPQSTTVSQWHGVPLPQHTSWVVSNTGLPMQRLDNLEFASQGNDMAVSWQHDLSPHWYIRSSWANVRNDPTVQFSGIWGQTHGAQHLGQDIGWRRGAWTAEAGIIHSRLDFDSGIVTQVSPIVSLHARVMLDTSWARFETGVLPGAVAGSMEFSVPDHMDAQGQMQYRSHRSPVRDPWIGYVAMTGDLWARDLSRVQAQVRRDSHHRHYVGINGNWQW